MSVVCDNIYHFIYCYIGLRFPKVLFGHLTHVQTTVDLSMYRGASVCKVWFILQSTDVFQAPRSECARLNAFYIQGGSNFVM